MKKIFTILLLFVSLSAIGQTSYYIDPAGVDDAGRSGAIGQPWATLVYAVTRVTTPGDTIHVNAGSFTSGRVNVPSGVSIVGNASPKSKFLNTYADTTDSRVAMLTLGAYGGNPALGNQVIKNIWIDGVNGGDTAYAAIAVTAWSNVRIYNCKITNHQKKGITMGSNYGGISGSFQYSTGNKIYNDTLLNNGTYRYYLNGGDAAIWLQGQQGIEIHDNYIRQDYRTPGRNGYGIKGVDGYIKGAKIYNNTIKCEVRSVIGRYAGSPATLRGNHVFAFEVFNTTGGNQLYNNTFINGATDFSGNFNVEGDSAYSWWVHHNYIYQDSLNYDYNTGTTAISIESFKSNSINNRNFIIEKNYLKNWYTHFAFTQNYESHYKNIKIRYNIFHNTGIRNGSGGSTISLFADSTTTRTCDSILIDNNVFYDDGVGYDPYWHIGFNSNGNYNRIHIRNNIFQGAQYSWLRTRRFPGITGMPTIDSLFLTNNIQYGNGSNQPAYTGYADCIIPTNVVYLDSVIANPLFINPGVNFDIQSSSPAINAGMDVGLTTDYVDSTIVGLPDAGAYEYYLETPAVDPVVVTTISPYYRTHNSAVGKGNVTNAGGGTISARGICWSTSINPTIAGSHTTDGIGTGAFTSRITGLKAFTTYYFRAYATNEAGTAYGENKTLRRSILTY